MIDVVKIADRRHISDASPMIALRRAISRRGHLVGMARWPCLTLLLLASAPTGHAGELHKISKQFRSAYSGGSDVDVQNLLIATEAFCKLLVIDMAYEFCRPCDVGHTDSEFQ